MRVLLRMHSMPCIVASESGRLLCLLFVRFDEMPKCQNEMSIVFFMQTRPLSPRFSTMEHGGGDSCGNEEMADVSRNGNSRSLAARFEIRRAIRPRCGD
jgi:hypothetical protein